MAHINIARRVFDSRTPGLLQLGTVWLPLPHLLILPFIVSTRMWQSGAGGSIPSMAGYVFGVLGVFRLARTLLVRGEEPDSAAKKAGAWVAAILYAANPNLIYMQATAMGETLYLALLIWATVYFAEFARGDAKALKKCALCLAAACLTRYDGWSLAAVLIAVVVTISSRFYSKRRDGTASFSAPPPRAVILKFVLIVAAAPILWLAYNAAVYRNPLEFANGPYSAKAIEQKTATVNPAKHNLLAAGSYFLKAAELNVAESNWLGRWWLALALLGSLVVWFSAQGRPMLLLWIPLPFYALSVAYGSVPIFVPTWWPFSEYNQMCIRDRRIGHFHIGHAHLIEAVLQEVFFRGSQIAFGFFSQQGQRINGLARANNVHARLLALLVHQSQLQHRGHVKRRQKALEGHLKFFSGVAA